MKCVAALICVAFVVVVSGTDCPTGQPSECVRSMAHMLCKDSLNRYTPSCVDNVCTCSPKNHTASGHSTTCRHDVDCQGPCPGHMHLACLGGLFHHGHKSCHCTHRS